MELIFEHIANLGQGAEPAAVHLDDNSVYLFNVAGGRLRARQWKPRAGDVDWSTPEFGEGFIGTADKNMSLLRIKSVPRVGIFGAWHQGEVLKDDVVLSPERQRFAIWDAKTDFSKYLSDCTIEMTQGSPIASFSMTLENPKQLISGEQVSRISPGMKVELFLKLGNSEEYPMGVQYVDRVNMGVTKTHAAVEGRSISGKLLRDQSLNENHAFPFQTYYLNVVKLLRDAGIENYDVQSTADPNAWKFGILFTPETGVLDALNELINAALNWVMLETMEGRIVVGSAVSYPPVQVNSAYTFERGKDVWSRDIARDDEGIYAKVCGRFNTAGGMSYLYSPVTVEQMWILAPQKTLHIQFPDNSEQTEVQAIIDGIAARLSEAGVVETFVGPVRPHLLVGDEARIISDDGTQILGIVTTVRHTLGKNGFMTEFTVDSGAEKGRLNIRDLIDRAIKPESGRGKRVFK